MSDDQSTAARPVEYRDIPGFPGYKVGNDGTIKGRRGVLKPYVNKHNGYLRAALFIRGRRQHVRRMIHRLVLTAFVGPCPQGMECRHLDGDKTNNHLSNLAWGTKAENNADMRRHGTVNEGERQWKAKLNKAKVRAIRRRHATGESLKSLSRRFGVKRCTIHHVVRRVTWKHVR